MTFNVRRPLPKYGRMAPDAWFTRAPAVQAVLRAHRPELVALQEVLPQQPFGSMYHLQRYNWLEPDWAAPAWGALKGSAAAANGSKVWGWRTTSFVVLMCPF